LIPSELVQMKMNIAIGVERNAMSMIGGSNGDGG
jgi:hypothetical protein